MTLVYVFGSGECEQLGTYHYRIFDKVDMFLSAIALKLNRVRARSLNYIPWLSFSLVFPKMIRLLLFYRIGWCRPKCDKETTKIADFRAWMFRLCRKIYNQDILWRNAHIGLGLQRNPLLLGLQWWWCFGTSGRW